MASDSIKTLTDENFEEIISQGIVLVDFYADWCGPCRMLSPIIEDLAKEMSGKVSVVKIDTDRAMKTASKYEVTSIPTLILFKNGKVMKRVVGIRSLDDLRKMVNEVL